MEHKPSLKKNKKYHFHIKNSGVDIVCEDPERVLYCFDNHQVNTANIRRYAAVVSEYNKNKYHNWKILRRLVKSQSIEVLCRVVPNEHSLLRNCCPCLEITSSCADFNEIARMTKTPVSVCCGFLISPLKACNKAFGQLSKEPSVNVISKMIAVILDTQEEELKKQKIKWLDDFWESLYIFAHHQIPELNNP